ncbi:MAG: VPLPA-CTERM sorting domain-containing protein [Pseudomonadota bacterium]
MPLAPVVSRLSAAAAFALAFAAQPAQALMATLESGGVFNSGTSLDGQDLTGVAFSFVATFDAEDGVQFIGEQYAYQAGVAFQIEGVGEATSVPGADLFAYLISGSTFQVGLTDEAFESGFLSVYDVAAPPFAASAPTSSVLTGLVDLTTASGLSFQTDAGPFFIGEVFTGAQTSRLAVAEPGTPPSGEVPLPAAGALLVAALGGLALVRRRGA